MATKRSSRRPTRTRKENEEEFTTVAAKTNAGGAVGEKEAAQRSARAAEVKGAVAGLSAEKALKDIATLQIDLSQTLSNVGTRLHQATQELTTVNEAIDIGKMELKTIYDIDLGATTLDQIVAEFGAAKLEWAEEEKARDALWEQEDKDREQERKRDEEEYQYSLEVERKQEAAKHQEAKQQRDRDEKFAQEDRERAWKLREAELKAKEQEFVTLKQQVLEFPKLLSESEGKGKGMEKQRLEKEHEHAKALLESQHAAVIAQANGKIESLTTQLSQKSSENEDLRKQLNDARQQVVTIATKGLESASDQKAFANAQSLLFGGQNQQTSKNAGSKA